MSIQSPASDPFCCLVREALSSFKGRIVVYNSMVLLEGTPILLNRDIADDWVFHTLRDIWLATDRGRVRPWIVIHPKRFDEMALLGNATPWTPGLHFYSRQLPGSGFQFPGFACWESGWTDLSGLQRLNDKITSRFLFSLRTLLIQHNPQMTMFSNAVILQGVPIALYMWSHKSDILQLLESIYYSHYIVPAIMQTDEAYSDASRLPDLTDWDPSESLEDIP